jgi:N-acetylglucosamine kinase-like BadF-type ATPase
LLKALDLETPDDLIRWAQSADRAAVVQLAATVGAVAQRGDPVASALVERSAQDLADHVTALLSHFTTPGPVTVALGGGVLAAGSPVRERLAAKLRAMNRVTLNPDPVDPVRGAVTLAAELATRL